MPPTTLAALRGTLENEDYVYKLAPRDITDDDLEALVIEPNLNVPHDGKILKVPKGLSDDPKDSNFVFEGYLQPQDDTEEEKKKKAIKRERIQDYFLSLEDDERQELEARLENRRRNKGRKAAAKRGVPFDERKVVAIAIIDGNQVWSLRADEERLARIKENSTAEESNEFVGKAEGSVADGKHSDVPNDFTKDADAGIGLELVSGYSGFNMQQFPYRVHGCISSTTEASDCFCSGTKISARLVITAGHCFIKDGETKETNYWLPGADGVSNILLGTGDTPNGVKVKTASFVSEEWFYDESRDHDWGVFVLEQTESNCDLGWLGYKTASNLGIVNICGYPLENTCEASPLSSKECGSSLYRDSEKVSGVNSTCFEYDIDTQGGMSGSGVYEYYSDTDNRVVVGVHVRGFGQSGVATMINSAVKASIDSILFEYPNNC